MPQGDVPGEMVLADAAVPDEAAGLRPSGAVDRRPDRLHAGAARGGGEAGRATRSGPIFTPPVVSRAEGPLATLTMGAPGARHQLARRLLRSRDAHRSTCSRRRAVATLGLVPPPSGAASGRAAITRARR